MHTAPTPLHDSVVFVPVAALLSSPCPSTLALTRSQALTLIAGLTATAWWRRNPRHGHGCSPSSCVPPTKPFTRLPSDELCEVRRCPEVEPW
jgi:hypothetical protein